MATYRVGLIGPEDLVAQARAVCEDFAELAAMPLPYRDEAQTVEIVRSAHDEVDALLFTGIVPWSMAQDSELLRCPAEYIPYSGATLLRGLVELLRLGHDVTAASIDTLTRAQAQETMTEARLPTNRISVFEYQPGLTRDDYVAFHRRARNQGATVAITCLRSAYEVLEPEMAALRLAPSRHSIRSALQTLLLRVHSAYSSDAQIAIVLLEVDHEVPELATYLAALGGSVARIDERTQLLVTTRGPLSEITSGFTKVPPIGSVTPGSPLRLGIGLGPTAAQAEARAWRGLRRTRDLAAQSTSGIAAVVASTDDADIVLMPTRSVPGHGASLSLLARRVGVRRETLERLRRLNEHAHGDAFTAKDVSQRLAIEESSARRLLNRLERTGLASRAGTRHDGGTGRPPALYRLLLG
jgi:hypothetical protein